MQREGEGEGSGAVSRSPARRAAPAAAAAASDAAAAAPDVPKPNYGLSGALAGDALLQAAAPLASQQQRGGAPLKWSEPADACVPAWRWHFHVFGGAAAGAGAAAAPPLYVHRQSATLFGRDRRLADVPTDHPSCSSQHAVLQFRLVDAPAPPGGAPPPLLLAPRRSVRPYILDLESTNGTFLNGRRIEAARYVELRAADVLRFGLSTKEWVLLHDEAATASG